MDSRLKLQRIHVTKCVINQLYSRYTTYLVYDDSNQITLKMQLDLFGSNEFGHGL